MARTHVLHVIHGLELGGLEHVVLALATGARCHGVDAAVVSFGPDGPMREVLARNGVPLVWLGDRPGLRPATLRALAGVAREHHADVLHGHDVGPWLNAVAAAALVHGPACLATIHDARPPRGARRAAAVVAARRSHALVACGAEVRRSLDGWAGAALRVTIENGVSLAPPGDGDRAAARARLEVSPGAVVVGYLGRLSPEKGPDALVDAFLATHCARDDVVLALVGGGPLEAELRRRAAPHRNVRVLGAVADGRALLAGFDVYAQPSLTEGRSLSMLEAMAAALPTVASRLPATQEVHRDGETALLVARGDPAALAAALRRLVDDAALRERLGAASRVAVQAHSADAMVADYVDLYRAVARASLLATEAAT